MTDEALIEELSAAMYKDDPYYVSTDHARAILPIIQRERLAAGEAVKEAAVTTVDDLELQYSDTYDAAVSDAYTALRKLNVEAIVGGGE